MAEPLVAYSSPFKIEIGTARVKSYKSQGRNQILADLIQAEGKTLRSGVLKLINFIWNKEKLPEHWKKCVGTSHETALLQLPVTR
jgi:mannosyltransferase OCH1-like enzyme